MENQAVQVALHLPQRQVKVALREQMDTGLRRSLLGLDRTVHGRGVRAHPSLQAGDVGLDLAEKVCLQAL